MKYQKYMVFFMLFVSLPCFAQPEIQSENNCVQDKKADELLFDEHGRTSLMNFVIKLENKIEAIKYGDDNFAGVRALVQDSYFLQFTYAYLGPWVNDRIQARVDKMNHDIQNVLDEAAITIKTMNISSRDFMVQDKQGETVLQYCTSKEVYKFLRQYGLPLKANAAFRIYSRSSLPSLLDYPIALACFISFRACAERYENYKIYNNLRQLCK